MGKVLVRVLQPFGTYVKGHAEVDESRLDYLLRKKLVRLASTGPSPDETTNRVEDIATKLSTSLDFPRNEGESGIDFLERMADQATSDKVDDEGSQGSDGGSEGGDGGNDETDAARFITHLKENLADTVVDALIEDGFNTIEALREASDKDLSEVKGVGPATLADIRNTLNSFTDSE